MVEVGCSGTITTRVLDPHSARTLRRSRSRMASASGATRTGTTRLLSAGLVRTTRTRHNKMVRLRARTHLPSALVKVMAPQRRRFNLASRNHRPSRLRAPHSASGSSRRPMETSQLATLSVALGRARSSRRARRLRLRPLALVRAHSRTRRSRRLRRLDHSVKTMQHRRSQMATSHRCSVVHSKPTRRPSQALEISSRSVPRTRELGTSLRLKRRPSQLKRPNRQ